MLTPVPTPALYLDLVGTVIHGPAELGGRFVNTPGDVTVFPEANKGLRAWKANGGRAVLVSNQGGVANGHLTFEDCAAIMARVDHLTAYRFDIEWAAAWRDRMAQL